MIAAKDYYGRKIEMDRLTKYNKHGTAASNNIQRQLILEKLALYEDTEFLPEEIARLKAERDAAVADLNELRKRTGWKCFCCYYDKNYNRSICAHCGLNNDNNWQWRGLEDEDGI